MVRTTATISQTCKDCQVAPREEGPRCLCCHRKWKAASHRKQYRVRNQALLARNPQLAKEGKRVCAKCFKMRQLTEFNTSQPKRKGKINKICDRCLSQAYGYRGHGLDYRYWRRRAYSVNSAARIRLAAKLAVPAKSLTFADLAHECKPQMLMALFEANQLCVYCHVQLTAENLTVDHVQPVARGGEHKPANLVLCCHDCNHLKHTKTVPEFAQFVRDYAARLMKAVEQWDKQPTG